VQHIHALFIPNSLGQHILVNLRVLISKYYTNQRKKNFYFAFCKSVKIKERTQTHIILYTNKKKDPFCVM
jgi:hypothetical protein